MGTPLPSSPQSLAGCIWTWHSASQAQGFAFSQVTLQTFPKPPCFQLGFLAFFSIWLLFPSPEPWMVKPSTFFKSWGGDSLLVWGWGGDLESSAALWGLPTYFPVQPASDPCPLRYPCLQFKHLQGPSWRIRASHGHHHPQDHVEMCLSSLSQHLLCQLLPTLVYRGVVLRCFLFYWR